MDCKRDKLIKKKEEKVVTNDVDENLTYSPGRWS